MALHPSLPRPGTCSRVKARLETFLQKKLRQVESGRPRRVVVRLAAVRPVAVRLAGTPRGLGSGQQVDPVHLVHRHSPAQSGTSRARLVVKCRPSTRPWIRKHSTLLRQ